MSPWPPDVEMFQWLVEHHVPVLIVATRIGKNARQKNVAADCCALGVAARSARHPPAVLLRKNEGRSDLLDVIREILV